MNIPSERIENFVGDEGPIASVWLDVEGGRLLATNGHMAMRVSVGTDENDLSGLVPVEAFELARKELKAIAKRLGGADSIPDPWLKVTCNLDAVVIKNAMSLTSHSVPRPKLKDDQPFPNVDAVFPELKADATVTLDKAYVETIMKSIDPFGSIVSLWSSAHDKTVAMATPSGKGIVVLMPMSGGADGVEVSSRGAAKAVRVGQ